MSSPPDPELEGRAAFGGYIGPKRLVHLVRNTAPYLFASKLGATKPRLIEEGTQPLGWLHIVHRGEELAATPTPTSESWTDYFALCVACHFASVATFVPTDVDTKIRDHLWYLPRPRSELDRMRNFVLSLKQWNIRSVSARIVDVEAFGPISGHDGERLSILAGGLLGLEKAGDFDGAALFESEIEAELQREAEAFHHLVSRPGRERDLLILAAALTHNAGDCDQGLSASGGKAFGLAARTRFGRLAHERPERYGGAFAKAALLYRHLLAAEGHRNYPLREIRPLRQSSELLLPVGPYFDAWGARLATHEAWSDTERAEVLDGLINACRKVRGQRGYFRALAGFAEAHPNGLEAPALLRSLGSAAKRDLKDADLRREIAVRRLSFESSLAKQARALLATP